MEQGRSEGFLDGIAPFHHGLHLKGREMREQSKTLLENALYLETNGEAANSL